MNPLILTAVPELIGLIRKTVRDKDAADELAARVESLALATPTTPLADGLHKLARPMLAALTIVAVAGLKLAGVELTPADYAALAGPAGAYFVAKGRGR